MDGSFDEEDVSNESEPIQANQAVREEIFFHWED